MFRCQQDIINNNMATLFNIWIILLPLIVWQGHYEVPKVFWLFCGGIAVLIFWILNFKKLNLNKRDRWFLLWIFVLIFSSYLGDDFKTSILGGSYRHQGIIFFISLWLVLKTKEFLADSKKRQLFKGIGIVVVIESILVILGKKLGTMGEQNAVSGFLAIGSSFVFNYLPKWLQPWPLISMPLIFSKSGFLALIPYIIKKIKPLWIVMFVVLVFILKPIDTSSIFENRAVIWKNAFTAISQRPILGFGAESQERVFDKVFYESGFPLSNLMIDRAHNLFLDVLIWGGIIGLIVFLKFLYLSYGGIQDKYLKLAFWSFLIYAFFQPLSVAHWLLFILII